MMTQGAAGRAFLARSIPADAERALAVASAAGNIALVLARQVPFVLDLTTAVIDHRATTANDPSRHRVVSGVTALPFAADSFDLVVCSGLLHCFAAPLPPLREFARVCRPGGLLLLSDHLGDEDPQRAAEQNAIERLRDPSHVWSYPPSELAAIIRASDLTIRNVETMAARRDVDEWLATAGTTEDSARLIRERLIDTIADDRAGLAPQWEAGRLTLTRKIAWIVAAVPGGAGTP
jgi:SAM-dependent methyltransferase